MSSYSYIEARNDLLGEKVAAALNVRRFEACYVKTAAEALDKALSLIPEGDTVSWGGSETCVEIGLLDRLRSGNYVVLDRDAANTPDERIETMRLGLLCDSFVMSANAISSDGRLVNIDGNGNRLAALLYGPKNVVVVAGINKVVPTLEDAISRARNYAAPVNARRVGASGTPCYIDGVCHDCKSEDCICANIVTTRICRPAGRIKVIIVGESLGF